jgi:tRNA-Thr(GGU) m(6)t(6)A37 methyltransferase TsaA
VTRGRAFSPPLGVELRPIGWMRSPQRVHHEAPRQPRARRTANEPGHRGAIEIVQGLQNCLHDLDGFSHVWVLFWCHCTRGWNSRVVPPRDRSKRGVFSTRAPARPNALGLSCLELLSIEKRVLHVGDHDLLDGTPVLDLKPYLPYCDSVPDARIGYAAALPPDAQDHRAWWRDKGVPPPRVYRRGPSKPQVR